MGCAGSLARPRLLIGAAADGDDAVSCEARCAQAVQGARGHDLRRRAPPRGPPPPNQCARQQAWREVPAPPPRLVPPHGLRRRRPSVFPRVPLSISIGLSDGRRRGASRRARLPISPQGAQAFRSSVEARRRGRRVGRGVHADARAIGRGARHLAHVCGGRVYCHTASNPRLSHALLKNRRSIPQYGRGRLRRGRP